MKKHCALRCLPSIPLNKPLALAFIIICSLALAHAQQGGLPADPCSQITSVGRDNDVTYNLRNFCTAVRNASNGQPYSVQLAQQILSEPVVKAALSSLRPSKQDGRKRAYAVEQLQKSAAANAASRLNTAVSATTQNRPDAQTTAAQTVNATTALVQKTGGPELLSFALESGTLTQSSTGNTSTVSGNLEGVLYTLVGMDPICFEQCGLMRNVLGDITTSATFTLNQQSTTSTSSTTPASSSSPPAGTAVTVPSATGQFTGFTAKFRILNKFDPHSATFRNNWNAAVKKDTTYFTLANSLMKSNGTISQAIFKVEDPGLDAEGVVLISDVLSQPENIAADYDSYATDTYDNAKLGTQDLATYLQNYSQLAADWQNIRAQGIGTLATIQYSYAKPMNQPETHTVTGIFSYAPKNSTANGLLTANLGTSIYGGAIPAGAKYGRLQYGQASAEFDRILFSPSSTGPVNLNLAGYWQYQPNPSVLNITQANVAPGTTIAAPTQVLVGSAGSLWVAQAQLQYKNKSGLSIPFGVKWSNKTQLLTGNKVGAQIGISYDFSFLSNMLNPSSK
jgi:hypothetical protein